MKDLSSRESASTLTQSGGSDTGIVTIVLRGDLSVHTLTELHATLEAAEGCDVVVLDLSAVDYVDSTTLTAFVKLRSRMRGAGRTGRVRIAQPSTSVRRIFEICHLDKLFELYENLADAQSA